MSAVEKPKFGYTFAEAAEACGVSYDVIKRAVRSRDLVASYPTARPVIDARQLQAWRDSWPTQPRSRT